MLCPCELVLRLQTLQPVEVEGQVVIAGPGRSGLVVRKSADAGRNSNIKSRFLINTI
jgi:D-arabinose 5-phosphate isomerase GutQ